MNLMEITKGYEPKQSEQQEQTKNSLGTTDRWKQLVKEQAETLEKVTEERDELQVRNQKMNEFILEFQKRTHSLKMEKQRLFFENHEMQEEMQKSNAEIQQMTEELSEMRKLNQSLQQSNDDLRNRNGLMSRSEQEQIEKEIEDDVIDFFRIPFMWYIRFCEWLVFPTYDNAFKQKIAYTGGRTWIIRILAIIVVFFILAIVTLIITEGIRQYEKMWDEISQMFLVGSLSGISVLGDAIREYLPVNLILLFGFVNTGIMLLKMYFRKKFDYM